MHTFSFFFQFAYIRAVTVTLNNKVKLIQLFGNVSENVTGFQGGTEATSICSYWRKLHGSKGIRIRP